MRSDGLVSWLWCCGVGRVVDGNLRDDEVSGCQSAAIKFCEDVVV